MNITSTDRINLKNLLNEMECDNNTETIRELKHSEKMRDDIKAMEMLKKTHSILRSTNPEEFRTLCETECRFLYNSYTDIFNKIIKDEIDLDIMTRMLTVLKMIEDGKVDQHEGSVLVGKILKELYLDSAVKRADNLDKEYEGMRITPVEGKPVSWKDFKKLQS